MSMEIMKHNAAKNGLFTVRKIAPFCALLALIFGSNNHAVAGCYVYAGSTVSMRLSLPASLLIQRDTPPGVIIWSSGQSTQVGAVKIICNDTFTEVTKYLTTQALVAGYNDVYQTNIPGIGFRVRNQGTWSYWNPVPASATYTISPGVNWGYGYDNGNYIFFKMELIYVGGNTSGKLTITSPLASLVAERLIAGQLYIDGSTTVTKVACSLNSSSINVPLGDVLDIKFTGVGVTTGDKGFDMGLNCDKEAKINVALAGTQNTDTTETSVLALTNAGQTGTAKGVGVQLLYGGVPLKINNNMVLKTSVGGQETLLFTARYYQTNKLVTPGKANSSATLNITYQ